MKPPFDKSKRTTRDERASITESQIYQNYNFSQNYCQTREQIVTIFVAHLKAQWEASYLQRWMTTFDAQLGSKHIVKIAGFLICVVLNS